MSAVSLPLDGLRDGGLALEGGPPGVEEVPGRGLEVGGLHRHADAAQEALTLHRLQNNPQKFNKDTRTGKNTCKHSSTSTDAHTKMPTLIYAQAKTNTHTHTHTHSHIYTHTHTYTTYTQTHKCTHMHTSPHIHTHTYTFKNLHTCRKHILTHTCTHTHPQRTNTHTERKCQKII